MKKEEDGEFRTQQSAVQLQNSRQEVDQGQTSAGGWRSQEGKYRGKMRVQE